MSCGKLSICYTWGIFKLLAMITIDSPYIQAFTPTYSAAIATEVLLPDDNYASLTTIGFGDQTAIVISDPDGAETLPEDWSQVTSVLANGESLTPALDPADPQTGEFVFNPYTKTVQAYTTLPVRSLVVGGVVRGFEFSPPYLNQPYPSLFTNLPLIGTIQLGLSFENHPSGSFEFETSLSKGQIQTLFAPGLELDLYGIGLRINSLNITELSRSIYAGTRCRVSVTFGGKLENYLEEPVFLRDDGKNPITNPRFECTPSIDRNQNQSTTIRKLLKRAGVQYFGVTLATVPIPTDTPRDATVNPLQLLQERLRVANSFVRWGSARGVEVIPITNLPTHYYSESDLLGEITTSYDAISKVNKRRFSSSNINPAEFNLNSFSSTVDSSVTTVFTGVRTTALSFSYPNVELSGDFLDSTSELVEKMQGDSIPRYTRKPPKREERVEGDANANRPPDGVDIISTMSLCFDIGGETKYRSTVTSEDGVDIRSVNETWGFVFQADQIHNDEELSGDPYDYWDIIKKTYTDYIYDKDTGYLLYIREYGYRTVRYTPESASEPETLSLDINDDEYSLYAFFDIPYLSRTNYLLRLAPDYSTNGAVDWVTVCNRDGTSSLEGVVNPNFVPPYYIEKYENNLSSFASRPNPDPEGERLFTGEEGIFISETKTTEAVYQQKLVDFEDGYPVYERGAEITPAKFTKYIKQYKAQGQQIADAVEESSTEQGTGVPPSAPQRPSLFVREESPKDKVEDAKPVYRYFLRTDDYSETDPINGTESFPLAKNFEGALKAAKCKAAIENWRNGLQEIVTIPGNLRIREGDRFNYVCNGESRQRVVLSVNHTFNILGAVEGEPKVTIITTLTLGQWILPNVEFSKILIPGTNLKGSVELNAVSQTIGGALDFPWNQIKSRRSIDS